MSMLQTQPGANFAAPSLSLAAMVGETIKLNLDQPAVGEISRIEWLLEKPSNPPGLVVTSIQNHSQSSESLEDRIKVNKEARLLEISDARIEDSGKYVVYITSRSKQRILAHQRQLFDVNVIESVPNPSVRIQPTSCGPSSPECHAICDGSTEGARDVTYSWNLGDEVWKQANRELPISNETAKARTIGCQMKNSVSRKSSDPDIKPFFQEEPLINNSSLIVGCCVFVVVAIIVGFLINF